MNDLICCLLFCLLGLPLWRWIKSCPSFILINHSNNQLINDLLDWLTFFYYFCILFGSVGAMATFCLFGSNKMYIQPLFSPLFFSLLFLSSFLSSHFWQLSRQRKEKGLVRSSLSLFFHLLGECTPKRMNLSSSLLPSLCLLFQVRIYNYLV